MLYGKYCWRIIMFYTKLIINPHVDHSVNDRFVAAVDERWKFTEDSNGRTKYFQNTPDSVWEFNSTYDTVPLDQVKSYYDSMQGLFYPPSVTYLGLVKVWNTESAAQGWCSAVQSLQLPGVTISYHGSTDPTVGPTV